MENEAENQNSESRPAGIGPGERLQAARIQQGLSIDDVASRMHLSVNILKSIEDNSFDDITAPIFVKGYLRAYARIVSLDEDELIEQYGEYYSHEDPPISTTSNMAPELSVADVRIKWTTYLVILGLAALLAAWWWNKKQGDAIPISLDSQSGQEQIVQQGAAASGGGMADSQTGTGDMQSPPADDAAANLEAEPAGEPEPGVETAVTEPVAEQPEPPQPAAGQQAVAEPATPEPAVTAAAPEIVAAEPGAVEETAAESAAIEPEVAEGEADSPPVDEEPAPVAATAEAEEAPSVRLGAPVLVAPTGSDKLSISINADTWADIKDATGFQMVYHLLRADQSFELTGSAPFSVFLGNGHGAEIKINGEEIDFSRRIRNDNTTRLSIGG
jgi:cytoskeleton protein RodZ